MQKFLLCFSGALFLFLLAGCGHDLSQFQHLKTPEINEKPSRNMLVIELNGDPNTAGKQAFGQLFKVYYGLKKDHKSITGGPPRARWEGDFTASKDSWTGYYGMPLPDDVTVLPAKDQEIPGLRIERWKYGTVAEILHVGSYASERPTIEKLYHFIDSSGYQISGQHEEEYLKGPGMFFAGNPDKYQTIIRYEVRPKE